MIRIALQICLTVMALLISASVSVAAECADDPNECTLKKLCEVATALDGGNTIWSTEATSAKHVSTAQTLGMECGITPIVDLCDTDPNECKLSQICGKATTESAGQLSWDNSAAAYVALAKEYGLGCGVNAEVKKTCSSKTPEVCSTKNLCISSTKSISNSIKWTSSSYLQGYVKEAKKRGLTCGVRAEVKKTCSSSNPELCDNDRVCYLATGIRNNVRSWVKSGPYRDYVLEATKRGLGCGVEQKVTKDSPWQKEFKKYPLLARKQIQYALKELHFYPGIVDGLWGELTNFALINYAQLKGKKQTLRSYPSSIFQAIINEVDVPSSFATTKKKVVKSAKKTINNSGLTSIVSSPTVAATQALAICGPQAKMAGSNAEMARQNRIDAPSGNLSCTTIGIKTNCRQRRSGPSNFGQALVYGVLKRNALNTAYNVAYNQVMDSCLASYGWRD